MPDESVNLLSENEEIHVFYMPAVGDAAGNSSVNFSHSWIWGAWTWMGRLIAGSCTDLPGGMGQAQFQVIRATASDASGNGSGFFTKTLTRLQPGCYVAIVAGVGTGTYSDELNPDQVLWYGWLAEFDVDQVRGDTQTMGTMTALGLGHLLDRQSLIGWQRKHISLATGQPLESPPTANLAAADGQIIGNAVAGKAGTGDTAEDVYLFARMPADCGTTAGNIWTPWRLLRHLAKLCHPTGQGIPMLKVLTLDQDDAEIEAGTEKVDESDDDFIYGFLNDTTKPEVINIVEPTFKGMLDILIPRARGLNWYLKPSRTFWRIVIYSHADTSAYGIPANNTLADLDLTGTADAATTALASRIVNVGLRAHADDQPDEITIEGGRLVWCATLAEADNNFGPGWDAAQQVTYLNGASGGAGYSALSDDEKRRRNRAVRSGPDMRDVFTRFGLYNSSITTIGDVVLGATVAQRVHAPFTALCPSVQYNANTGETFSNPDQSKCPYLPSATFLRTLPWIEGVSSNGNDTRNAASKASPQYMKPKVFRYDTAVTPNWRDITAENGANVSYPCQLDVDDNGPAVRLTMTPPEALAKGAWTGAAIGDINPDGDLNKSFPYSKLVFTLAIESDQRVSATVTRTDAAGNAVASPMRRVLIRDESLQCWAVHKNTILGLGITGVPDRVDPITPNDSNGYAYFVRNDFPLAYRRARQMAAFAFRERVAVTIERARPDEQPTWAQLGRMIQRIVERNETTNPAVLAVRTPVYTVIEEVRRDFGRSPRLTVTSDLPAAPNFGGGGVSVTMGGTVKQAVRGLQSAACDLRKDGQRVPVITPAGRDEPSHIYYIIITGGNTLSDTVTAGIKYTAPVTTVPSLYDPNVTSTFVDGIGRGVLYIDDVAQSGYVLVVNDSVAAAAVNTAVAATWKLATTLTTRSIPLASDATQSVTTYIPYFK